MTMPAWVRTTAALLLLAAAVTVVTTRTWRLRVVPDRPDAPGRHGFIDFRDGIYYPTVAFVSGDNPYDAATYLAKYPVGDRAPLYSPLMYLMHAPFTALPFGVSGLVYLALGFGLTVALAATILHWSGVPPTTARVAGLGALLMLSRPGLVNLFNGQVTLTAVFATYLAFWHAATRPAWSALGLAFATFKGTYGLPTALLLWARGDRRVVALGVLLACLLTAPAVARIAVGAGGVAPLVESLRDTLTTRLTVPRKRPEHSPFRIDAVALTARTLGRSPTTPETIAIMAAILGAAGAAVRRLGPSEDRGRRLHATSIAALATVAAFYHQSYDGLALALPLVVLVARPDLEPWRSHPTWRWTALGLLALPFLNFVATESAAARLGQTVLLAASSANGLAIVLALAVYVRLAWRIA